MLPVLGMIFAFDCVGIVLISDYQYHLLYF